LIELVIGFGCPRKAGYATAQNRESAAPLMQNVRHLLRARRFAPLFATQFLGAFNDSLFKQGVVLFVTYQLFSDAAREAQFSAIAQGLFILPFFLFSALAGQLADDHDKARLIRIIKMAEILIMIIGGAGLLLENIPLMLLAVLGMGIHSTFFGPIKYAILPQHLQKDEVLGGTGLVEAGTYIAILGGTILAGVLADDALMAVVATIGIAGLGLLAGRQVPPAPPAAERIRPDWHIVRASVRLVSETMHVPRLFLAILAISFFWTIGAVLIIIFPPLVKNVLGANEQVASLFIAIFSIGIAIGSVAINRLLKSEGLRPFCISVGNLDGAVRGPPIPRRTELGRPWVGTHHSRQFHFPSERDLHDRGAARRCRLRWHVRGAALCLPDHYGRQVSDRAHGGRQQHRQFGGNGRRIRSRLHPEQLWRWPCRTATVGRGNVHCRRMARLEAPPGL
jgi:Na+/melibiose symporter-like transporter